MWRHICAPIVNGDENATLGALLNSLKESHGAAVTPLIVRALPMAPYGLGAAVIHEAYRAQCDETVLAAADLARQTAEILGGEPIVLTPHADRIVTESASMMRSSDLVVMAPPNEVTAFEHAQIFDAALFQSGRPVLVVPRAARADGGHDVVIAWKDCRESARALHDAMPMIRAASRVRLIAVHGAEDERFFGQAAMDRIVALLDKHGVQASGISLKSGASGPAETLLDAAQTADVIVMGAYGRWRMTERLFGGMTKDMLARSPVPILMSH